MFCTREDGRTLFAIWAATVIVAGALSQVKQEAQLTNPRDAFMGWGTKHGTIR